MAYSFADEPLVHTLGGGDDKPLRLVTDGQIRLLIRGDGTFEWQTATTAPVAGRNARTFFRVDEAGKVQFCVQFPTGVAQVLSTEP